MRERAKVLLTVFALVVFMASPAPAAPAAITIERIVAKINQEIITLSTLQDFVFEEVKNLRGKYKGEELERQIRDIELRALDVLIERMLVLQRAKDLKLKVGDKDLESAIELVMARNRLNVQTFRRFLKVQGTTLEEYRKRMRDQILARRAESIEVNIRVTVNEEEIAEFYKNHIEDYRKGEARKVQQLFFPVKAGSLPEEVEAQRKKAEEAHRASLQEGADFGGLAKRISEGPAAQRGGVLGFVKKGEVFPEFEKALFALASGKVSEPVKTRAGFHVLRVMEVKPGILTPLEEISPKIRGRLFKEKRAKRRREWIATLKRSAFLEVNYTPNSSAGRAAAANRGELADLFRNVREQVTLRLVGVELLKPVELLGKESLFWSYGAKRDDPRWESERLKVNDKNLLVPDALDALPVENREIVNPDPAANIFLYEYNYLLPNKYLGTLSLANVIKAYSLNPKKKRFSFLTESKSARFEFEIRTEKTRSILADTQEISQ